jgi:hypothetical protein
MLVRTRPFLFNPQLPLNEEEVLRRLESWTQQFTGEGAFCPRCGEQHPTGEPLAQSVPRKGERKRYLLHCDRCQRFNPRERWFAPRRPQWM